MTMHVFRKKNETPYTCWLHAEYFGCFLKYLPNFLEFKTLEFAALT